jgi:hypothetical protein
MTAGWRSRPVVHSTRAIVGEIAGLKYDATEPVPQILDLIG